MSYMKTAALAAVAATALLLLARLLPVAKKQRGRRVRDLKRPSTTHFLLGNLAEFDLVQLRRSLLRWGAELENEDMYCIRLVEDQVYTHDYDIVRQVFVDGQANYHPQTQTFARLSKAYNHYQDVLGLGLVNAMGHDWKERRDVLVPLMQPRRLNVAMLPYIAEAFDRLVLELRSKSLGVPVDVDQILVATIVDIIYVHFFGRHPVTEGIFKGGLAEVADILHVMVREVFQRIVRPAFLNRFYTGWRSTSEKYNEWVKTSVRQARRDFAPGCKRPDDLVISNPIIEDILSLEKYQDEAAICAEFTSLIFAGHDTTAHTIAFALGLLARHPEMQERVCAEADEVLGPVGSGAPSPEQLSKLEYCLAVFKETSRLYTLAPAISAIATKDTIIKDVQIPKGTSVTMNMTYIMHRPRYFPDPFKFDPERWLEFPDGAQSPKAPRSIPVQSELFFSIGSHACVGARLASMEVRLAVAKLCQAFKLTLPDGANWADDGIETAPEVLLKPANLHVIFLPRD